MKLHVKYFEKKLGVLPVEELWKIIEELILPHPNAFDKKSMSYSEVLELAVVLKSSDEIFKNLEQIAMMKGDLDEMNKKF
ncbi:MAG TPA: hypothetical protein VFX64_06380 [Candidatus Nitrosotalea sp.]|nr:hypothetical protein [Candidatus Nitrosotalea sp.]